jgi:hypothetical protein
MPGGRIVYPPRGGRWIVVVWVCSIINELNIILATGGSHYFGFSFSHLRLEIHMGVSPMYSASFARLALVGALLQAKNEPCGFRRSAII